MVPWMKNSYGAHTIAMSWSTITCGSCIRSSSCPIEPSNGIRSTTAVRFICSVFGGRDRVAPPPGRTNASMAALLPLDIQSMNSWTVSRTATASRDMVGVDGLFFDEIEAIVLPTCSFLLGFLCYYMYVKTCTPSSNLLVEANPYLVHKVDQK